MVPDEAATGRAVNSLKVLRGRRVWKPRGFIDPVRAELLTFSRQRSSKPDGFTVRGSDMAFCGPRKNVNSKS